MKKYQQFQFPRTSLSHNKFLVLTKENYQKQLTEPIEMIDKLMKEIGYNVNVKENEEKLFYFLAQYDDNCNNFGGISTIKLVIETLTQQEVLEALEEIQND